MRVTATGTSWIVRLWLNSEDISRLASGNVLETRLPNTIALAVVPSSEATTRLERVDDTMAWLYLPHPLIESIRDGAVRSLKAYNGGLPLLIEVTAEPGVGLPAWMVDANLQW